MGAERRAPRSILRSEAARARAGRSIMERPPLLGGRSMVGHAALDRVIGVRIPASQPLSPPYRALALPPIVLENGDSGRSAASRAPTRWPERIPGGALPSSKPEGEVVFVSLPCRSRPEHVGLAVPDRRRRARVQGPDVEADETGDERPTESGQQVLLGDASASDANDDDCVFSKQPGASSPRFGQELPVCFQVRVAIIAVRSRSRPLGTAEEPQPEPLVFGMVRRIEVRR